MRGALRVVVVFVGLLAAFATTQPAAIPAKLKVAVADFEVVGGKADLGSTLANALEGPLFKSGRFELYDRRQTGKLLEEFRFSQSGLTEAAAQTLKARNIDVLITGTINVISANVLQVSFRFINVSTSQLQFADTVRADGEGQLPAIAQELVAALGSVFPLRGAIIGTDPGNQRRYYVNVGFGSNIAVGQAGDFYRSEPLPSGGSISRRAGSFKVVELTSDPDKAVVESTELDAGYAPKLGDAILIALSAAPGTPAAPVNNAAAPSPSPAPATVTAPRTPPTPWTIQLGGAFDDRADGIATDTAGNVYVVGSTHNALDGNPHSGAEDAFLTKYGPDGSRQYTRQWGTARNDAARAVAVDTAGNVYVAGETSGALDGNPRIGNTDAFLSKFGPNGQKVWTRQWGSRDHTFVNSVAANASLVVVAGAADAEMDGQPNAGDYDAFVTRLDVSGKRLDALHWGTRYRDQASGVALDASGSAYVAGSTAGALPGVTNPRAGRSDAFLIKVGPDGKQAWAQQWGGAGNDEATAVAVDVSGNPWVVGTTDGAVDDQPTAGERDAFATRFEPGGKRLSTRQWGTPASDEAGAVTAMPGGGILVVGGTAGALDGTSLGGDDAFITRLDPSGTVLWNRQWGGSGSDAVRAVASDRNGNAFAAGMTDNLAGVDGYGDRDSFLVSFAPGGARR